MSSAKQLIVTFFPGTYQFTLTVMNADNSPLDGALVLNKMVQCKAYARHTELNTGVCVATVTVTSSEAVYVTSDRNSTFRATYTSFSGHLVTIV